MEEADSARLELTQQNGRAFPPIDVAISMAVSFI